MELVVYSVPVAALIVGLVEMAKRSFRMSAAGLYSGGKAMARE